MSEMLASEFWVQWGRTLQRLDRLEERADSLQEGLEDVRKQMSHWGAWARRGAVLAAIWGSLATAGLNHDQASTFLAAFIRALLRLPGSAG